MEKEEIISTLSDIYQAELVQSGTTSFDAEKLKDMSLEELKELLSHY